MRTSLDKKTCCSSSQAGDAVFLIEKLFVVDVNHQLITTEENSRSLPSKKIIQVEDSQQTIPWLLSPMKKILQQKHFHSQVLTDLTIKVLTFEFRYSIGFFIACNSKIPRPGLNEPWETKREKHHLGNYQIEISNIWTVITNIILAVLASLYDLFKDGASWPFKKGQVTSEVIKLDQELKHLDVSNDLPPPHPKKKTHMPWKGNVFFPTINFQEIDRYVSFRRVLKLCLGKGPWKRWLENCIPFWGDK